MAPILARARARARRWRRELGGGVRQHPGSNNCVEGAYGIARFDRREPVESDEHARSTCGVRELRHPPVRRSVAAAGGRRAAADVDRLLVANGCWWRTGDAGGAANRRRAGAGVRRRRRATARQRATNTTLAATRRHPRGSVQRPTRHSPPHGDIDADDICCCGRRPRRAVQLRGARQSMVLKNQQ